MVGFTKLGLLEMTRRRKGPSLSEILGKKSVFFTKSDETIALEILRSIPFFISTNPGPKLEVHAAPDIISVLKGELKQIHKLHPIAFATTKTTWFDQI